VVKLVRFTYAQPDQLRMGTSEAGYPAVERIPNHPTRLARPYEFNSWLQEPDERPFPLNLHGRDSKAIGRP
jgi:hypothetical protein